MNFMEFIQWERSSRDSIDLKKTYIDMADDILAGLLLSQIIYWYLPDKEGNSKLRVEVNGHKWLVKKREDWFDEIRMKPRQFDRAIQILKDKRLVITDVFKFGSTPMLHIRINDYVFMSSWKEVVFRSNETVK